MRVTIDAIGLIMCGFVMGYVVCMLILIPRRPRRTPRKPSIWDGAHQPGPRIKP